MKALPLGKVYQLMEPGPVVMLTTAHKGRAGIMAMSWHMMVDCDREASSPASVSEARLQLCRLTV